MKYNELSSTAQKFLEIATHWVNVMWVSDVERELFGMHTTLYNYRFYGYSEFDHEGDTDKLMRGGWIYENRNSGKIHLTRKGQQVLPKYLKAIQESLSFTDNGFLRIGPWEIAPSVAKRLGYEAK